MNANGDLQAGLSKGWAIADDYMSLTLDLREEAKWSNGDPFTAEDFTFFFYELQRKNLGDVWGLPRQVESVSAVNDYTVRYDFSEPFPKMLWNITNNGSDWNMYAASTWLKQWHIKYNPNAAAMADEEGYDSWQTALTDHNRFCCLQTDPDRPSIHPLILTDMMHAFRVKERNPYYIGVDTEGKQLPYIDPAIIQVANDETINLKVISGESHFVTMPLESYSLLETRRMDSDYKVNIVESWVEGDGLAYSFNLKSADPMERVFIDIGLVQAAPTAVVFRANLMNVPNVVPPNAEGSLHFNSYVDQMFFKE